MSEQTVNGPAPIRQRKPKAIDQALLTIALMEQEGVQLTYDNMEKRGISNGTASKALGILRAKHDASTATRAAVTDEQLLASAEFTPKAKLSIEKAIALHQKRLDKAFQTAVSYAVQKHLAEADAAMRKQNAELRQQLMTHVQILRSSAQFTVAEFRMILMCLHPDNSASPEVRARAFDLVRQKEARLTGGAR